MDRARFREFMGQYPTGVCIITGVTADGAAAGMTVGTFTSVSLDPPLVGFFPDKKSTSWPTIGETGRFCVNILADDQEALCRMFSGSGRDRFADVSHRASDHGLPVLDGVVGWIDCDIHSVQDAGDHLFVLGAVKAMTSERTASPLVFHCGRFGKVTSSEAVGA